MVVPLTVAFVLSVATYALTASNTVPASKGGTGATAVSGYTVSAVHYNLNASDPRNIDSVTFTVDTARRDIFYSPPRNPPWGAPPHPAASGVAQIGGELPQRAVRPPVPHRDPRPYDGRASFARHGVETSAQFP